MKTKHFALIGAAGFIAPRHMRAIRDTGNSLLVALDKSDSVGVIDSYFPECEFFTEFERFDRHVEKLRNDRKLRLDYVSICSPNYLHDSHIRFSLRVGADAVCEKPVVLNPWNVDALARVEREHGRRIYTILQLRLHPDIVRLREKVAREKVSRKHEIDLTYITPRGRWYLYSWKGDLGKSGGLATNIGIHFFDMLAWIFGPASSSVVHLSAPERAAGFMELKKARVRWFLSIDAKDVPVARPEPTKAYRVLTIDGEEFQFSEGFTELHTECYRSILSGGGFRLEDARESIEIAHGIRHARPARRGGEHHPLARGRL